MLKKLAIYKNVAKRPYDATIMLWHHRRTLRYLWKRDRKSFWNHIFTTYLIRGEDCGKGILDPLFKLTGWAPFLWDIEMETTTACYLKCIHCEHTYWKDKSYLNQHLKIGDLRHLVNSIPNLHWINLTGEGTSILNPDFNKMIRFVKSKGIYLDFSHDFVKLSDEAIRTWVECGVDRVYFSFDGVTKETYEAIRVGARFEDVCENVKRLVAYKKQVSSPLPEICFRYTFFKHNMHEVSMIPSFLASLVDDVKDYGDEPSINIVALLEFKETKDWAREIHPVVVALTNMFSRKYGFTNYWSHTTHIESDKPPLDYCTFWSEPYVMITGHVVPDCAVMMSNSRPVLEKLSFGNIYEQSLKEIWDSEKYRRFRKMVVSLNGKVPRVCLGCRVFNTQDRARRYGIE